MNNKMNFKNKQLSQSSPLGERKGGSLKNYLESRYTKGTVKRYYSDILTYLNAVTRAKAETAKYSDIVDYIESLRKKYDNPETIKVNLQAIKKYYNYLNYTKQRKTHPCRNLNLKDKQNRDIQLQDLFKTEELEQLMNRKERYKNQKYRNQILISLLIYQGLTTGEIIKIELKDIDLEKGEIYIKSTHRSNSRTLKLKPKQIMIFYKYINEIRTELILKSNLKTDKFLLTKLGTIETGNSFKNLFKPFKMLFPNRNLHAKTIRQSVIANLLKQGTDLRKVQYFAGHKFIGSTEKYRQTGIEELKAGIEKYHPLNK